ncbi:hypothetical protein ACWGVR_33910 [Streptomyces xanthophaeus]
MRNLQPALLFAGPALVPGGCLLCALRGGGLVRGPGGQVLRW